jgi:PAS domain S-box-containing protein
MIPSSEVLFSSDLWKPALEKYASAAHLTVKLFDNELRAIGGPIHSTPLFRLFDETGYDPGIFVECVRRCLVQTQDRPAVIVSQFHGLAVMGTSLVLEGKIVGAAVGGYVLADFSQVSEIQSLARKAGIAFDRLWEVARQQQPVPQNRLIVHGELLQVLGDALLRENYQTRQYAETAAIVSSSDDAIVGKDLNGIITSWNRGAERLFGYTAREAVGQSITMLIPADHLEDEPMILGCIRRGETVDHYDTVRRRKDGALLDISLTVSPIKDPQGRVVGASKIARDITDRKKAQEAVRQSEEHYRILFDLGPVAVYSCDASGVIKEFNRRSAELWGRTPAVGDTDERFCGSFKLYRPDGSFMPHEQCPMAEVVSGKISEARDAEVLIERPDHTQVTVIVNIRPLKDQCGEIVGAINCFYDITERKQAEEALQHAHDELESLVEKRTASLRRLSTHLQHVQDDERRKIARDLHDSTGQNLAALKMNLAQLHRPGLSTAEASTLAESEQVVDTILAEIRTISHLLHPPLLDETGLSSAARWYTEGFEKRSGIKVELNISSVEKRLPQPVEMALFRALQESLTNVHRHSGSSKVDIRIDVENGEATLAVRDYGRGVSSDQLAGFEKGIDVGVGLVGMRERIKELNGKFKILPEKPGTSVIVTIPTKPKQAETVSSMEPSEESGSAA